MFSKKKKKKHNENKQPKKKKKLGECFLKSIARDAWQNVPKEAILNSINLLKVPFYFLIFRLKKDKFHKMKTLNFIMYYSIVLYE